MSNESMSHESKYLTWEKNTGNPNLRWKTDDWLIKFLTYDLLAHLTHKSKGS